MKLTDAMRDALEQARRGPLRRVHDDKPGRPPWPAHPGTLAALVRHALVERGELRHRKGWPMDLWTVTDAGREALNPPPRYRSDRPLFLARPTKGSNDYTTLSGRAIDDLEIMDPEAIDRYWANQAEEKREEAADARAAARKLRAGRKAA